MTGKDGLVGIMHDVIDGVVFRLGMCNVTLV